MATEIIKCTDCGAVFRGIPAWLTTAKVKFTCTNCPKRSRTNGANRAEVITDVSPDLIVKDIGLNAIDGEDDIETELDEDGDLAIVLPDLDDEKEVEKEEE